jgi:hypothetical protein
MKLHKRLTQAGFKFFDIDHSSGNKLYLDEDGNVIEVILEYGDDDDN